MVEPVSLKSNRVEISRLAWSTAFFTSCMSTSDTTSKVGMARRYRGGPQGSVPEWPKGADCKSAGTAFDGSNPSRPTFPTINPMRPAGRHRRWSGSGGGGRAALGQELDPRPAGPQRHGLTLLGL